MSISVMGGEGGCGGLVVSLREDEDEKA